MIHELFSSHCQFVKIAGVLMNETITTFSLAKAIGQYIVSRSVKCRCLKSRDFAPDFEVLVLFVNVIRLSIAYTQLRLCSAGAFVLIYCCETLNFRTSYKRSWLL